MREYLEYVGVLAGFWSGCGLRLDQVGRVETIDRVKVQYSLRPVEGGTSTQNHEKNGFMSDSGKHTDMLQE